MLSFLSRKRSLCCSMLSCKRGARKERPLLTVRDAIHRGYDLLGVGIVAVSGISFFSDLPAEIDQIPHMVDEGVLALLAIVAFVWYLSGSPAAAWLLKSRYDPTNVFALNQNITSTRKGEELRLKQP